MIKVYKIMFGVEKAFPPLIFHDTFLLPLTKDKMMPLLPYNFYFSMETKSYVITDITSFICL